MGTGTEYRAAHVAEDELKETNMAKTENFTHYTCDRCGADAYLQQGAAAAGDWREVERFDQYGSRATRLLCKGCTDEYKKLAAKHDGEFQQFMSNAKE